MAKMRIGQASDAGQWDKRRRLSLLTLTCWPIARRQTGVLTDALGADALSPQARWERGANGRCASSFSFQEKVSPKVTDEGLARASVNFAPPQRVIRVPDPWSVRSSISTACGILPSRMTTPSTPRSIA